MQPLAILLTLAAGLALPGAVAAADAAGGLQITAPYVRAVPPGQPNSAAFMELTNRSDADRALVAAASDAAAVVELHTHRMEDGMMVMRQVAQIDLPAGVPVVLAPGGLHVMLIGLKQQLQPGDAVELTLVLDDGEQVSVTAPVQAVQPPMHGHQHQH